jgi:serine/threonine-protein kinase HipA
MAFEASISPDDVLARVSAYGRDTAGALGLLAEDAGLGTRPALRNLMTDIDIATRLRPAGTYSPAARSPRPLPASSLRSCYRVARSVGTAAWTGRRRPTSSSWAQNRTRSSMTLSTTEAACIELATMVDLTDIGATVTHFDGVRALVISGYDRTTTWDGQAGRVHQEDTLRHSAWTPGT